MPRKVNVGTLLQRRKKNWLLRVKRSWTHSHRTPQQRRSENQEVILVCAQKLLLYESFLAEGWYLKCQCVRIFFGIRSSFCRHSGFILRIFVLLYKVPCCDLPVTHMPCGNYRFHIRMYCVDVFVTIPYDLFQTTIQCRL